MDAEKVEPDNDVASVKAQRSVRRTTLVLLVVIFLVLIWYLVADRFTPYTTSARLKAYVVKVVPDVSGYVAKVPIKKNQLLEPGDTLLQIETVRFENLDIPDEISVMVEKVRDMLKDSLDALVSMNVEEAKAVCDADDEVDDLKHKIEDLFVERLRTDPARMECLLQILLSARHLERIADHATNIAEDVIYMITGEIVRHWTDLSDNTKKPS